MGRTQVKKKIRVKVSAAESTSSAKSSAPSVSSLLEKAQTLIIQCDYELAEKFVGRILQRDPTNVQGTEMLGLIQLETGELDAAKVTFANLVSSTSTPPPSALLYLAQLSVEDPHVAIQHYKTAIDILSVQMKGKEKAIPGTRDDDEAEIRQNIVRALVGQVEIWMDPSYDLCFDPNAEKSCEELIKSALSIDPGNSEALQALASVRMSQQRPEEAKASLEQAWSSWKDLEADDERLPSLQSRLDLVKLFLELSLFTPALQVLAGIMASDDQSVEAWYLEGWCFYLMAEQAKESPDGQHDELSWEDLAKDARNSLETCQVLHINEENTDELLLEHTQELISNLESLGIKYTPPDEDGEEWEDFEESDEEGDVQMKA